MRYMHRLLSRLLVAGVAAGLGACTINPVTGDRELALVSPGEEVAIGESQYAPSRQMQGGDYVIDPALISYVQGVGQRVAAVSDRSGLPYEFTVLNSSVPNAWALPGGKIAVNRGLLTELDNEAELAAVLAHEVVHAAARHGALAMQRGLLLQGALIATSVAASRNERSDLVVGAASVGAQLINQRNGRGAELESDEYGMRYMSRAGYDPAAAVSLQETFLRLSQGREQGWLAGLFASHPPSAERVERNRETAAMLPPGGELGEARYAAAMALLESRAPAYETFDEAQEAFADDRPADARRLATQAVEQLPGEAQFHGLLGDIALDERRIADAERHFRDAQRINPRFFYYPLRLGLTLFERNQIVEAESFLAESLSLLPTADAHLTLGKISERRGDIPAALEHYQTASGASSASGQAAQDAVVRIELPGDPGRFLSLRTGLDNQNRLLVEIGNPTGQAIADINFVIRYAGADGRVQSIVQAVTEALPAGQSRVVATGLGPFQDANAFEVALESARVIANP